MEVSNRAIPEKRTASSAGERRAGMPARWRAIFRARCKGQEHPGIGREKAEAGRQDADHRSGNAVYANLLSNQVGIGVVSLPPKRVGKNGNVVGFGSGFLVRESASDRGAEPKSREKIRRHAHGLEAFRRAGLDRKSTRLNSSHANISYAVFCLKKKK